MPELANPASNQINHDTHDPITTDSEIKSEQNIHENTEAWIANQHINGVTNGETNEETDGEGTEHPDAPAAKRRKIVDETSRSSSKARAVSPPWKTIHAQGPTSFLENGKRRSGRVNHADSPSIEESKKDQKSRAVSPPWKAPHAQGPTSFLEDGKRRSGRVNAVPLQLQPPSKKRQTRASYDKATEKHNRPVYSDSKKKPAPQPASPARHVKTPSADASAGARHVHAHASKGTPSSPAIKKEPPRKTAAKSLPTKDASPSQQKRKTIKKMSQDEMIQQEIEKLEQEIARRHALPVRDSAAADESLFSPGPPATIKKVTFRLTVPKPTVTTPANIASARQYDSFEDFMEQETIEDPAARPPMTSEQIWREAAKRLSVQNSCKPGQVRRQLQKQLEPRKEYAHRDYLLAHIDFFRTLLKKERSEHRRQAQVIAHEAKRYVEAKQSTGRVKTMEEVVLEQRSQWIGRYKNVVKDVTKLWQAVEAEVNMARQKQYEQEQQEKLKGHLNRVLDRTDAMLKRNDTDMTDSDIDVMDEDEDDEDCSNDGQSDNSEQMSASESDSAISVVEEDPDATMSLEELQAKYNQMPDIPPDSAASPSAVDDGTDAEENSDPETIMDSELDSDGDSDSDDTDDDDEDEDDNNNNNDQDGGLLSLFSKKEIQDFTTAGEDGDEAEVDGSVGNAIAEVKVDVSTDSGTVIQAEKHSAGKPKVLIEELPGAMDVDQDQLTVVASDQMKATPEPYGGEGDISRDESNQTSPRTSVTKVTEAESVSSLEQHNDAQAVATPDDASKKPITPIPPLLRGTLRKYQHEGLDWLANLYANGRSGILADEMGLGKTIQSISLLAHLATTYEVWGPHLIVVPTSVMLNWEMEFKKFLPGFKILTYYGDQEERKQKRRGWMADDSFNVCITSYQLVLKDANSFKRRKWHYMILDEAHNIKNFRSERWQTMMTFNTRARLLLTGTPLQNNLTELWSLLFFLHYGQENEGEDNAFAGLQEWSQWFKKPVESILEHGNQVLDREDQEQVAKLHKLIRPFLLRRLKRDVEKQMPLKYEHVEMCRLSKRQRQLYDGFMSRAQTRETLASGNYLSIINALMQLRKVCNHPDLFETRPINTSFAMPKSVAAQFEITDLLVRRKLFGDGCFSKVDLDFLELVPVTREDMSTQQLISTSRWNAYQKLRDMRERQWSRIRQRSKILATADRGEVMLSLENVARSTRLQLIDRTLYYDAYKHHRHPLYGQGLLNRCDLSLKHKDLSRCALDSSLGRFWEQDSAFKPLQLVHSLEARSRNMTPHIDKFACITPAAVAIDLPVTIVGESRAHELRRCQSMQRYDPFHQARMKLSIAFPDKRLLQYDCGKLQRLDKLLRRLQAGGHRALIFTQMTKVLDILEQFLNIHGHRYLRLDGATKIEQRQILTDRFNNDTRILAFILSSRSGGLGINLTGADTVIFYDLDWNPAMDKQCTDRAHRIGQTRDVHIYRFVSEHTIESNILRKANQKQLLDDVVIQEGDFTTEHLNKMTYRDMLVDDNADEDDVAGAAMDRVLGNTIADTKTSNAKVFEQAEDQDDVAAARVAEKEFENADDGDFDDQPKTPGAGVTDSKANALDPFGATNAALQEVAAEDDAIKHVDEYLLRLQKFLLKDVPLVVASRDRSKRGKNRKKGAEGRRR